MVINDSDDDCEAKGDDQSGCTERSDDCFLHQRHENNTYKKIGSTREGLITMYESPNQRSTAEDSTVGEYPI